VIIYVSFSTKFLAIVVIWCVKADLLSGGVIKWDWCVPSSCAGNTLQILINEVLQSLRDEGLVISCISPSTAV
jgi:hypothetical protein